MSESFRLRQAQRGFAAAVRSSAAQQDALLLLAGDAARNQQLLAVYRGNSVANADKALRLAYPVVERIVGEEFFGGLCRAFWQECPSRSGDLNEYGEGFGDFLANFPHVAELPYLADVARVEWLVGRAAHAADHVAATLAQLANMPSESIGALRFGLQPGLTLFVSTWPVATIWQQHQATYTDEINIDLNNAECLAVHRLGLRVEVTVLSTAELALWRQAQAGQALAAMLETAFAVDDSFDIQGTLQAGFAREFITSLHA
ncbi:MAG: hypothetical protein JWM03_1146 [Rhodocyclales bacterium]|nr:hypothetical protein [Rhodocyclales bacterium]